MYLDREYLHVVKERRERERERERECACVCVSYINFIMFDVKQYTIVIGRIFSIKISIYQDIDI